jgi:hypothetical protein
MFCFRYITVKYVIIIICPFPSNGAPVELNSQGKTEELGGKTCPSATLSTTNPTWTDPGSKPGLRGGRPAANRLSHGTAKRIIIIIIIYLQIFRQRNTAVLYVITSSGVT